MRGFLKLLDLTSVVVLLITAMITIGSCTHKPEQLVAVLASSVELEFGIIPGAENIAAYHHLIKDKTVGMVVNQTSRIGEDHLVDSLLKLNISIKTIFAPEHGFRGKADAGEKIIDGFDMKTGIPLISLYGKKKKPAKEDLEGLDVIVFDIQDVGARFYTYISSLHYVMEACAENGIDIIVLDRPNPNAHYIDGPILEEKYASFVGLHPVPVVYGMTIGEYAQMINGEKWLANGVEANLTVIQNSNYSHDSFYELPVKPSPNLPNIQSILLYPSLCFFEGTNVSIGRGTDKQFQVIGHPKYALGSFLFTPTSMEGAKYPKHENVACYGLNLQGMTKGSLHDRKQLNLSYLIDFYKALQDQGEPFFLETNFFEKLAGTDRLRKQIVEGLSEEEIRQSWKSGIEDFRKIRANYLLYD